VQVRPGLLSKKAIEKLAALVPSPVQVAAWVGAPQKKQTLLQSQQKRMDI
jgi:hypothetical protein